MSLAACARRSANSIAGVARASSNRLAIVSLQVHRCAVPAPPTRRSAVCRVAAFPRLSSDCGEPSAFRVSSSGSRSTMAALPKWASHASSVIAVANDCAASSPPVQRTRVTADGVPSVASACMRATSSALVASNGSALPLASSCSSRTPAVAAGVCRGLGVELPCDRTRARVCEQLCRTAHRCLHIGAPVDVPGVRGVVCGSTAVVLAALRDMQLCAAGTAAVGDGEATRQRLPCRRGDATAAARA